MCCAAGWPSIQPSIEEAVAGRRGSSVGGGSPLARSSCAWGGRCGRRFGMHATQRPCSMQHHAWAHACRSGPQPPGRARPQHPCARARAWWLAGCANGLVCVCAGQGRRSAGARSPRLHRGAAPSAGICTLAPHPDRPAPPRPASHNARPPPVGRFAGHRFGHRPQPADGHAAVGRGARDR